VYKCADFSGPISAARCKTRLVGLAETVHGQRTEGLNQPCSHEEPPTPLAFRSNSRNRWVAPTSESISGDGSGGRQKKQPEKRDLKTLQSIVQRRIHQC